MTCRGFFFLLIFKPMHIDNRAKWDGSSAGFYEVWYLKLNLQSKAPAAPIALWLRFTTLSSTNGLKKKPEIWAIFFEGSKKIAIKNTASLGAYSASTNGDVQIEDCVLTKNGTSGSVINQGHNISWDLSFDSETPTFFHVPSTLQKLKLTKSTVCKPSLNLKIRGSFTVDGKEYRCEDAPGCQGHIWGKAYVNEWAWAHSNHWQTASGKDLNGSTVLELLTAKAKLGGVVPAPALSAAYFEHAGQKYEWNTLTDQINLKSSYDLEGIEFKAEKRDIKITGKIHTFTRDMVCVTYEAPAGELYFCKNTEVASAKVWIYRNGRLEVELQSNGSCAFETVSKNRSPYVEVLL